MNQPSATRSSCEQCGSGRPVIARGRCVTCYDRWYRAHGKQEARRIYQPCGPCQHPDCTRRTRTPGVDYCPLHYGFYQRFRRSGVRLPAVNDRVDYVTRDGVVPQCRVRRVWSCGTVELWSSVHGLVRAVRPIDRRVKRPNAGWRWAKEHANA